MVEKMVRIVNKTGLHARPAKDLCNVSKSFECKITLLGKEQKANAKSIINILTMDLNMGEEVLVRAEGADEAEALETVTTFISELTE